LCAFGTIFEELSKIVNNNPMKKLIKASILTLIIGLLCVNTKAQNTDTKKTNGNSIKWVSLTEAEKLMAKKKKKIFVDVYTDWCGWCKRLDATTYKDQAVVSYLNEHFYSIKLNAETKDTILYQGIKYSYDPNRRINTIAPKFLTPQPGYPTLTYLDDKLNVVRISPGYVDGTAFLNQLKYINENYYLNMTFEKYMSDIANGQK
jgi:thioredoxin-related protein